MLPELLAKMTVLDVVVSFFWCVCFLFCFWGFFASKLEYSEFSLASLMCDLGIFKLICYILTSRTPNLSSKTCSLLKTGSLLDRKHSYLLYNYLKIVTVNNYCNYSIAFTAQIQLKMSGQLIVR